MVFGLPGWFRFTNFVGLSQFQTRSERTIYSFLSATDECVGWVQLGNKHSSTDGAIRQFFRLVMVHGRLEHGIYAALTYVLTGNPAV